MKGLWSVLLAGLLFLVHSSAAQESDPDDANYKVMCQQIELRETKKATAELKAVLERLQGEGLLPKEEPLAKAEEFCKDERKRQHRICSYYRKQRLIKNVENDFQQVYRMRLGSFQPKLLALDLSGHLWCKHPECIKYQNEMKGNCRLADAIVPKLDDFKGFIDCKRHKHLVLAITSNAPNLQNELNRLCEYPNSQDSNPFCLAKKLKNVFKRCLLQYDLESSTELTKEQMRANILLNSVVLRLNYPDDYVGHPVNKDQEDKLHSDYLNTIMTLLRDEKYSTLKHYVQLLPSPGDIMPLCAGARIAFNKELQRLCTLGRIVEQSTQILQSIPGGKPKLNGIEKSILHTDIDYRKYLEQGQIGRLLGLAKEQKFELKTVTETLKKEFDKSLGARFEGLKNYFTKVEEYNRDIAQADIGFIAGTLENFNNQVEPLAKETGESTMTLLKYALSTSIAELGEKVLYAGLRLFEAGNIFKSSGTFGDVLDALGEVAEAMSQVARAGALHTAFTELIKKVGDMQGKLDKNAGFIKNVQLLIDRIDAGDTSDGNFETLKKDFLEQYNNYTPQLTKPELTETVSYFETFIDECCDVIGEATAIVSSSIKTELYSKGLCWKTPVKATKLFEIYAEIYDFQFDLMDSLAAYVRSSVSVSAAADINAKFDIASRAEPEDVNQYLEQLAALSFIANEAQRLQTIEAYCDVLEYKAGGKRPSVCQGKKTDIKRLIAYEGSSCERNIQYVDIPTVPSKKGDTAFLNLTELYEGKAVNFRIPDSNWLVEKGWIFDDEKNNAIFLTKFEVYLPVESQPAKRIRVVAKVAGGNRLIRKDKEYTIFPEEPLVYEYMEGEGTICRQQKLPNPYKLCPNDEPIEICPRTNEQRCAPPRVTSLHNSIYAKWQLRMMGYTSKILLPDPATPVSFKAGLELCKFNQRLKDRARGRGAHHKKHSAKKLQHSAKKLQHSAKKLQHSAMASTRRCCSGNQYWSSEKNACTDCPPNSVRRMHGYYCDKNKATLSL